MKFITTSIILALAGFSLGSAHISLPIPPEKDLKGAVPGYLLVKYKKEDAAAISSLALNPRMVQVNSRLKFQSRLGKSAWIMYQIPTVVDPVQYADYIRQTERTAIRVENVHRVHVLLTTPNDPDFNYVETDDYANGSPFFLDFRGDETLPPLSFRRDWHLDDIDAFNAWSVWPNQYYTAANKPKNIPTIAVIDSGCDMDHPDFRNAGGSNTDSAFGGQLDKARSAYIRLGSVVPGGDLTDYNGHGTHTAGLALASANNGASVAGQGTMGTGYSCKGMIINCIDANGTALDSDVATSIYYATDNNADVISLSVGGNDGTFSYVMQDAVTYATEKGSVVVCAGNEDGGGGGNLGPIWPAACSGALGVTANGPGWSPSFFSGYGNYVDVGAPGGDFIQTADYDILQFVWSTATRYSNFIIDNQLAYPPYTENYTYLPGTSMACPIVSGGIGTYMGKNNLRQGNWNNIKAYRAVELAAQSQGAIFGGWEPTNGYGFFDMQALMIDQDSRLATVGAIEGVIYNAGNVAPQTRVFAQRVDPNTLAPIGIAKQVSTDGYGVYRFAAELAPGIYDVHAAPGGVANRKDFFVQVSAGSDRSGVDLYCGPPSIDSDGPIVSRCNITASSATNLTLDHWAYDPETRLEGISMQVLNSSNAVVVPSKLFVVESTTAVLPYGSTLANGSYTLRVTYTNGEGYTTIVNLPFTIGPSTTSVGGTITLQSYPSATNVPVTMQLRTPGTTTVIESYNLSVHSGSTFSINTVQRGNFDIAFKGTPFMRKVLSNVNITNTGVLGLAPSLKNGDCDGNNVVGTTDFNLMRSAWGSVTGGAGWNVNCDLDGNGVIGTGDFNVLRSFWGQVGDN